MVNGEMIYKVFIAIFFIGAGLYYIVKPERIAATFAGSANYYPRKLQGFLPIKFYQSRAFLWVLRIGGILALVRRPGSFFNHSRTSGGRLLW